MVGEASGERIGYLESIRGLSSLQVLLLHAFSAFLPALVFDSPHLADLRSGLGLIGARIHHSALFLVYDGYAAVFVFFILSGLVLTLAYEASDAPPSAQIAARTLRLLIPACSACLFSAAVLAGLGPAHRSAGLVSGSDWLIQNLNPPSGFFFFLKDVFLNSILLGYRGSGTLAFLGQSRFLDPLSRAYAAPLWTLSIEFQGSLLVLLLTWTRRRSPGTWGALMLMLAAVLFRSYFLCFLVGHLLARLAKRGFIDAPLLVSAALIIFGGWLGVAAESRRLAMIDAICSWPAPGALPCVPNPQAEYAAICIFLGVISSSELRRALSALPLRRLGAISFPLYLFHWPIVLGLGSVIYLHVWGSGWRGRILSVLSVVVLGATVGRVMLPLDQAAIQASRAARRWLQQRTKSRSAARGRNAPLETSGAVEARKRKRPLARSTAGSDPHLQPHAPRMSE